MLALAPVTIILSWITFMTCLSTLIAARLAIYDIKKLELTIGQITGTVCQVLAVIWTLLNIAASYQYDITITTWHMTVYIIGFYSYDLIHLLTYAEGRKLYVFHAHHIAAIITAITILVYPEICSILVVNMLIALLELSGASVNITALCKQFVPAYNKTVEFVNILIYVTTRNILYPCIIIKLTYDAYFDGHILKVQYLIPGITCHLLILACVVWGKTMIEKYYERYMISTRNPEL
jgi:hypothetical protein